MTAVIAPPGDGNVRAATDLVRRTRPSGAPVLDVVVPVYNEQADLERCVRRLHAHHPAFRVDGTGARAIKIRPPTGEGGRTR